MCFSIPRVYRGKDKVGSMLDPERFIDIIETSCTLPLQKGIIKCMDDVRSWTTYLFWRSKFPILHPDPTSSARKTDR